VHSGHPMFISCVNALIAVSLLTNVVSLRISPFRVVVAGGGAAGCFAAIECARTLRGGGLFPQKDFEIVVLESCHECLGKVLLSGGGRCNVMHDPRKPLSQLLQGYPRGRKELTGIFTKGFGPRETMEWFVREGVLLITECDGRVFPVSNVANTVTNTLLRIIKHEHITLKCNSKIEDITIDQADISRPFKVHYSHRLNGESKEWTPDVLNCDRLIVATGGSRYYMLNILCIDFDLSIIKFVVTIM
jgi:predicted flavoprotein YhiN